MNTEQTDLSVAAPVEDFCIERPRLLAKLDDCSSRIVVLVAPPGYGKTTLAQQWIRSRDVSHSWYSIGPESTDVAAVAANLAEAISVHVPRAGERMLDHLASCAQPCTEYAYLAELLARDASPWPENAWLILDDCHKLPSSSASYLFVQLLLNSSRIRSICISRDRPSWARSRSRLYGDVLEIDRSELGMTPDESLAVLTLREDQATRLELVRLCDGWPAVIGLAARNPTLAFPRGMLPPELYDYFAEELYEGASIDLQRLLCQLSVSPTLTIDVFERMPLSNTPDLIELAERIGFLSKRPTLAGWYFHPLVRAFLQRKLSELPDRDALVSEIAFVYFACDRSDEIWGLIQTCDRPDLLERLIASSLSAFLDHKRLSTVESWIEFGRSRGLVSPLLDLVESELALLSGDHPTAYALSLQAARQLREPTQARHLALSVAGRSAHFLDRLHTAVELLTDAASLSPTPDARFTSAWTRFLCFYELEDPSCFSEYDFLQSLHVTKSDASLRLSQARLLLGALDGPFGLEESDLQWMPSLLDRVHPETRTGFLLTYTNALVRLARYSEADSIIASLLSELKHRKMYFGLPSTYLTRARIEIGRRRYRHAELLISSAGETPIGHLKYVSLTVSTIQNVVSILKGELPCHRPKVFESAGDSAIASRYYESVLALGVASHGNIESVEQHCERAETGTLHSGVRSLVGFARAICDIRCDSVEKEHSVARAINYARERGQWETLVWSYRAFPRLLDEIAHDETLAQQVGPILAVARDDALGRRWGIKVEAQPRVGRGSDLSRRESEILQLVADGMTNREIADRLFISEVTVKVHLRHVFRKLGVRSRTQAALQAVYAE